MDYNDPLYTKEHLIVEAIAFMQAVIAEYGAEKGEEMWDTIVLTLDPSLKRQILMKMITGDFAGRIIIRGYRGECRKVPAIKAVRNITGLGLKEAKDLVDRAYGPGNHGGQPTEIAVGPHKRRDAIKELEAAGCIVL